MSFFRFKLIEMIYNELLLCYSVQMKKHSFRNVDKTWCSFQREREREREMGREGKGVRERARANKGGSSRLSKKDKLKKHRS